ncbi:ATP-binding protein [Vibrio genomosp. F10]|uniref:ATP-binding protein n=1 Tax=Vibrio genomosp. F10 TaxID=723171 RepID=UPI00030467B7|nr:ATP-binding protein [Vibrio genomosp. F10]OEF10486.1 ATPase [Vibrio genomosp. F10 str. 9ZB36]
MNSFALLYLDNNPISVEQLRTELSHFATRFDIHAVDSIEDAHCTLEFCKQQEQTVALVIASHHSEFNGAEFLIQLDKSAHTKSARKILLSCGQDIQAILSAVNEGRLDHCLTKPLQNNLVYKTVKKELTTFVIEQDTDNLLSYSLILDQQHLLRAHIDAKMKSYQEGFISDHHRLSDAELAEQVISALEQFFLQEDDSHACRTYSADHLLTKEGEENRFLWFITEGKVALYKKDDLGQQREVVRHDKGNIVGGMSFVTGELSFSTAITLTKTKVIKLDRDIFTKVMHSNTHLLPLFTNLLLRHFNRRLQRSINTKLELQKTLESLETAHQQLIEKEKMAMLGQLVAGVAHELNNPIAAILRGTETLTSKLDQLLELGSKNLSNELTTPNEKGKTILDQALISTPTSTSEDRAKSKLLDNEIKHRLLAKKLVKLRLENDQELVSLAKHNPEHALELVNQYDLYHLTGTTLRSIGVCAHRIADMVKSLKGYARPDDECFHSANIYEGIEDTLVIFENKLKHHTVVKEYCELPKLYCQPIALQQVWTNLISNAIDALPIPGELKIHTSIESIEDQHWVVICFEDNGTGITPELQEQIFTLNFTTKKEGNFGLGIGLSVCHQIINQHNGRIEVESVPNEFTRMAVWLPIHCTLHRDKE